MNRRDVLHAMFLGSVIAETGLVFATPPSPRVVIFDSRYAPAREFAASAAGTGATARAISGDVTAVWHAILDAHWLRTSAQMAGMTTAGSLFCLEQLVADCFWRTTSREPRGELTVWAMAPRMRGQA